MIGPERVIPTYSSEATADPVQRVAYYLLEAATQYQAEELDVNSTSLLIAEAQLTLCVLAYAERTNRFDLSGRRLSNIRDGALNIGRANFLDQPLRPFQSSRNDWNVLCRNAHGMLWDMKQRGWVDRPVSYLEAVDRLHDGSMILTIETKMPPESPAAVS